MGGAGSWFPVSFKSPSPRSLASAHPRGEELPPGRIIARVGGLRMGGWVEQLRVDVCNPGRNTHAMHFHDFRECIAVEPLAL